MSTVGVAPDTVIVSSTPPIRMSAFTVAVNVAGNWTPSRFVVMNPGRANVTTYVPGLRSTILYNPSLSVSTERTLSIRTGLAASTETPGSTAPVASFTTPAMALCAEATLGSMTTTAATIATAADKVLPLIVGALPQGTCESRTDPDAWRGSARVSSLYPAPWGIRANGDVKAHPNTRTER